VLLERAAEVAALSSALDQAADGEAGLVLVLGPAGSGKTRLLEELRRLAHERGVLMREARGGELERDLAWGTTRDLLSGIPIADESALRGAAAVLDPSTTVEANVETVLYALTSVVADAARDAGPLVLCVDDVHWADEPSRTFLLYLARRLAGLPLLLVLAARPADPDGDRGFVERIAAEPGSVVLELASLTESSVAQLLTAALPAPPDAALVAACYDATGGVALLVTELADELARRSARGPPPTPEEILQLAPTGVTRSVVLRLAQLGDDATALAHAVAVLDDEAALNEAAALADLTPREAGALVSALIDSHLLADATPLRFAHPLIRTAVLHEIGVVEARALHARAARMLRMRGAEVERVALQLLSGEPHGDPDAVAVLRDAAAQARRRGAPAAATRLLARALEEPPPADARADTLVALASAELAAGSAQARERVEAALDELTDPATAAALVVHSVEQLLARPRLSGGSLEPLVARGLHAARAAGDSDAALRLRALEALTRWQGPTADATLGRALERELRAGSLATPTQRYALVLALLAQPTNTPERAIEVAHRTRVAWPDGLLPIGATTGSLLALLHADETEDALGWIAELEREQRDAASLTGMNHVLTSRAYALFLMGDLAGAEAEVHASETLLELPSFPMTISTLLLTLLARGNGETALEEIHRRRLAGELPEGMLLNAVLHARGVVRRDTGDLVGARADFEALRERMARTGLGERMMPQWRVDLALTLAAQGEPKAGRAFAAEQLRLVQASWPTHSAQGIALCALGTLTPGAAGRKLLEQAIAELERSPRQLELARALVALGSSLRRSRRRAVAREPLTRGMEIANRCGAIPLAERARDELRATGARPRRLALSGVQSLTPSELRVARLAASGATNRDIAQELYVTLPTVETHLRHVFQKLDLTSRQQIADALAA
jgi:DNA-binding CsgD family transcriptional regulator